MQLILWRHCEAAPGEPDEARPLTPRGHAQAARMGAWLGPRLPGGCRILVSPAIRAQQTARALARSFETVPEVATGASVPAVLAAANWPHAREPVLVVGHQPTLGNVAAFLLSGDTTDRAMATGAVWWLSSDDAGNGTAVSLRAAVAPDFV